LKIGVFCHPLAVFVFVDDALSDMSNDENDIRPKLNMAAAAILDFFKMLLLSRE